MSPDKELEQLRAVLDQAGIDVKFMPEGVSWSRRNDPTYTREYNHFVGPAPDGYSSWGDWLYQPVKRGAKIMRASEDDFRAAPEAAEPVASKRPGLERALEIVQQFGMGGDIIAKRIEDEIKAAPTDSQAGRDALDAARWRFFEQHASNAEFRLSKEPNTPKWVIITAKFDRVYGLGNRLRDLFDAALAAAGRGA